jgi:DNA-directed RNA polymerase specialized sigma24 family protein
LSQRAATTGWSEELVDPRTPPEKKWRLTQTAFDKLLSCLDSDRERAGEKYERLRLKLVKFFEWHGTEFPEERADQALDRITRRIDEGEIIRDLNRYAHGVARLLWLEALEELKGRSEAFTHLSSTLPPPDDAQDEAEKTELRLACFRRCLQQLPPESCELITEYYQKEKRARIDHRNALAERLQIPPSLLRVRAHRIRRRLETCVETCLRRSKKGE